MKRLSVLLAFLFFTGMVFSQVTVNVSGTVVDTNGDPVENVTVYINVDSTANNFVYYNDVLTASDGTYSDTFEVPSDMTQGAVYVYILDCNNTYQYQMAYWSPAGGPVVDFVYCNVNCSVEVEGDDQGNLTATGDGAGPFTYLWNTGESSQSISVNIPGYYCVTLTDAVGCSSDVCYYYEEGGNNDTLCWATIYMDTVSVLGTELTAYAYGTAPYSYLWNTGETTSTIVVTEPGEYCATVTDSEGCESVACYDFELNNCSVYIAPGNASIFAIAQGVEPFTYEWDTGETTSAILPMQNGVYCVTVTDAIGCVSSNCIFYQINGGNDTLCNVNIGVDSTSFFGLILTANASGNDPIEYLWNTGENTQTIEVTDVTVEYCVTIVDASGCTASACVDFSGGNNCSADIVVGNVSLLAEGTGTAPFTYQWSTGELTQSIMPMQNGTYCVTITDANGCSSTDCAYYQINGGGDSCGVNIQTVQNGGWLQATPSGTAPFTYAWSTGESTPSIAMTENIVYCVTVSDATNCVAIDCFDNTLPGIAGYVFAPDSILFGSVMGTVNLFSIDGDDVVLVETTTFDTGNGGAYYNFDNLPDGNYIVQAIVDPTTASSELYIPTYHEESQWWNEADVIVHPGSPNSLYNIFMIPVEDDEDGPGVIGGNVYTEDGFWGGHDDDERNNNPMADVEILLHNSSSEPIDYAFTGADGSFVFDNLAYGTYTVYIEIPGKDQVSYTVTIGPDSETVSNINFTVGETSITTATENILLEEQLIALYPNPVKNTLNVNANLRSGKVVDFQVVNMTGQTVRNISYNDDNQLDMSGLNTGVYILKVQTTEGVIAKQFVKE